MSDFGNRDKLTLAGRLQREARASRPEFSEDLHERMCRALWPCETGTIMVARVAPPRGRAGRWLVAAAAAASVLIVAGFAWRAGLLSTPSDAPLEAVVAQHEPAAAVPGPLAPAPLPVAAEIFSDPAADFEHVTALVDEAAGQFNEFLASAVAAPRFTYLDQDASLAEGLAEHLPFGLPLALASSVPVEDGEP
jgi:hypothetical protein